MLAGNTRPSPATTSTEPASRRRYPIVSIRPFSSITTPVPSRSAPRVSAVRASGTVLMLSFTTPSKGTVSADNSGTATWVARQVDSAAAKKETVTIGKYGTSREAHVIEVLAAEQRGHAWGPITATLASDARNNGF